MKQVAFRRFGAAAEVATVEEVGEPEPPRPGEALVALELSPIEQADLHRAEGLFADRRLPYVGGLEGMGRVLALGDGTAGLRPGQRVLLPPMCGAWSERLCVPAVRLIPVPDGGEAGAMAQLTVNPPTAWLMLRGAQIAPGDFVVQNAAASSCGRYLVGLARWMGFRTINVVRSLRHESMLRELGADAVLEDGPDLAERVRHVTDGAGARLAIDAVGGEATARLAASLEEGGELVVYGMLSRQPCRIDAHDLVHRRVTARGFFLKQWFDEAPATEIRDTYRTLADLILDGRIASQVERVYRLGEVREALSHMARPDRCGRILLGP